MAVRITRVNPQRAQLQPVQGRKQVAVDSTAFGSRSAAALESTGAVVLNAGNQLSTLATDLQIREDEAAAKEADINYTKEIEKVRSEYMITRGKNALAAHKGLETRLTKIRAEVEKGLAGERQKAMFKSVADARTQRAQQVFNTHRMNQQLRYEDETSQSRIQNQVNAVALNASNEKAATAELMVGENEIRQRAQRLGWSSERLKLELRNYRSRAIAGAISSLVDGRNLASAKRWFKKHEKTLTPKVRANIKKVLDASNAREEAQAETDNILLKTDSFDEQLAEARKIKDGKKRDEVVRRLKIRRQEQKFITDERQRKADDEAISKAYEGLRAGTYKTDSIPPTQFNALSPKAQRVILNLEASKHRPRKTDFNVYAKFLELDKDQWRDRRNSPLLFADKLSDQDLRYLLKLQRTMLKGDNTADRTFTTNTRISTFVAGLGLKKNAPAQVKRELQKTFLRESELKGSPLTEQEEDKILERFTLKSNPDYWPPERPLAAVLGTDNEGLYFRSVEVPKSEIATVKGQKVDIIDGIRRNLIKKNRRVTPERMRYFYLKFKGFTQERLLKHFPEMKGE